MCGLTMHYTPLGCLTEGQHTPSTAPRVMETRAQAEDRIALELAMEDFARDSRPDIQPGWGRTVARYPRLARRLPQHLGTPAVFASFRGYAKMSRAHTAGDMNHNLKCGWTAGSDTSHWLFRIAGATLPSETLQHHVYVTFVACISLRKCYSGNTTVLVPEAYQH